MLGHCDFAQRARKDRIRSLSNPGRPDEWDQLPLDRMCMGITSRFVNSDLMMVARVNFDKGDWVPLHRHVTGQHTYVIRGILEFGLGE